MRLRTRIQRDLSSSADHKDRSDARLANNLFAFMTMGAIYDFLWKVTPGMSDQRVKEVIDHQRQAQQYLFVNSSEGEVRFDQVAPFWRLNVSDARGAILRMYFRSQRVSGGRSQERAGQRFPVTAKANWMISWMQRNLTTDEIMSDHKLGGIVHERSISTTRW